MIYEVHYVGMCNEISVYTDSTGSPYRWAEWRQAESLVSELNCRDIDAWVVETAGEIKPAISVEALEADLDRHRDVLARLHAAVASYGRIGHEGSELLEVMSDAREVLDTCVANARTMVLAEEPTDHAGAFAQADLYRARCVKAEAALLAVRERLLLGGGVGAVIADVAELAGVTVPLAGDADG